MYIHIHAYACMSFLLVPLGLIYLYLHNALLYLKSVEYGGRRGGASKINSNSKQYMQIWRSEIHEDIVDRPREREQ
jgi:hypothetical protein